MQAARAWALTLMGLFFDLDRLIFRQRRGRAPGENCGNEKTLPERHGLPSPRFAVLVERSLGTRAALTPVGFHGSAKMP
jgi:hypothetical protein